MNARLDTLQPPQYDEASLAIVERRLIDARGEPVSDRAADEALLRYVGTALRLQLSARRAKGLTGWHAKKGLNARLQAELRNCVENGLMVEAMRCAAVIHLRAQLYGPEA